MHAFIWILGNCGEKDSLVVAKILNVSKFVNRDCSSVLTEDPLFKVSFGIEFIKEA